MAQKLICYHLMKSRDELREEAEQSGPDSTERLRRRMFSSHDNHTSGLWMRPAMNCQLQLSNREHVTTCCKRNAVENPRIPKANPLRSERARQDLLCKCSSNRTLTYIDPFGYHLVRCRVDAHAIRLHDNVVRQLVVLLQSLGLAVSLEPIHSEG